MNAELVGLLASAGVDQDVTWRDIVVRQNYAPVPAVGGGTPYTRNRGFNMVVLTRGVPRFFCKIRPAGDAVVKRETFIRACLAEITSTALSVAPARMVSSERLAVQVAPFLGGVPCGRMLQRQSPEGYVQVLRTLLEGITELARTAMDKCAGVRPASPTSVVSAAAAASLDHISSLISLEPRLHAVLADALSSAGSVPTVPQHGDYWWQNVLMSSGRVWVIDFDAYSEVQIPLYDALTMACSTQLLRSPSSTVGFERLMANNDEARACRGLLVERANAVGVARPQLDGVLVYYLATMASDVTKRGGKQNGAPHIEALRLAAELLASGKRDLLAGDLASA